MTRREGVLSLMNGFSASMLRELVYSGFRLGTYEFFKDQYAHNTLLTTVVDGVIRLHTISQGSFTREGVSLKVLGAMCSSSIGSYVLS